MQGICVRLNCDREDPEDYGVVALGVDGKIYPLCQLFEEDIEIFKASVEIGFEETELFADNECLREFVGIEEDPRLVIIYAENMDPRVLGMICYKWIMEYPMASRIVRYGVSEDCILDVSLQEDLKQAMDASIGVFMCQEGCDKDRASLSSLSRFLNTGSRKPLLMGPGESDRLFLLLQAVSSLSVLAIDIIDGFKSSVQEAARYISRTMLDLLARTKGAKGKLKSAMEYQALREDIIAEQVDVALCIVEDMNAWSVEFEVE